MISLQNISKSYTFRNKKFKALQNISLDIAEGDIVGVIGSSGAGKSTLLRMVNLLEKPDTGKVIVNGIDLTKLNTSSLNKSRKKIGMIFQHFNLLASKTVFENIALPLRLIHKNDTLIKEKVNNLLELVGLMDKSNDYPKNLSGGQRQRVAIARTLVNDPNILLCDEATSALDPATTQSILQLIKDINQKLNITILLITHEMHVVKSICNKIAVIDKGQIIANGTIDYIVQQQNIPIIQELFKTDDLSIPNDLSNKLNNNSKGLHPIVEIELNASISFEEIINSITKLYNIEYKIIKANIEYFSSVSYGKLLIQFNTDKDHTTPLFDYFNNHKIKNKIIGYA